MPRPLLIAASLLALAGTAWAQGKTVYVSGKGSNENSGESPTEPVKAIWKGIELAGEGGTVRIAEGSYEGRAKSGRWEVKSSLTLVGGYAEDFSVREPFTRRTRLVGDGQGNTPLLVECEAGETAVIDGLTIDGVNINDFTSGSLSLRQTQVPNLLARTIGDRSSIRIRNCLILNASNSGIYVEGYVGPISVTNCVILGARPAAIEVSTNNRATITIEGNTLLTPWRHDSRPPHTGGHAVKVTGAKGAVLIKGNLMGLSPECAVLNVDGANPKITLTGNVIVDCPKGIYETRINRKPFMPPLDEIGDADLIDGSGNTAVKFDFGLTKPTQNKMQKLYAPLLEDDDIAPLLPSDNLPGGAKMIKE